MKCPHCGQEHPDNTKYCPETGKKMEFDLLSCSNPNCVTFGKHILPRDSKFCPDCGMKLNVENEQDDESRCFSHTSQQDSGDDFVDLGLSVKWAKCNLGAKSPEEYGNYYAWGETEPKNEYTIDNSKAYGKTMFCIAGKRKYDAATAALGQGIRLPTKEEIEELVDECSSEWTSHNGVYGQLITGPNGNSIFLPAAGRRYCMLLDSVGESCGIWSCTPVSDENNRAWGFGFDSDNLHCGKDDCSLGYSIRPVRETEV